MRSAFIAVVPSFVAEENSYAVRIGVETTTRSRPKLRHSDETEGSGMLELSGDMGPIDDVSGAKVVGAGARLS